MTQRLVTTGEMREALQGFPFIAATRCATVLEDTAPQFADAAELARHLVEQNCLTDFQAKLLLEGRIADLVAGNYCLLEPVGAGGMGQVFKAWHTLLHRHVAIKVVRHAEPRAEERFRREIRLLAQLKHLNIVAAHDAVRRGGQLLLVMEYCEGATLGDLVRQHGPLSIGLACNYIAQAAQGLEYAFARGLTHRDLKPDNLMIEGTTVKILDFGLARLRDEDTPVDGSPLTSEATVLGTPDFVAPEQALDSRRADIRSDIYSLGATLYYLLTAHVPFPGGTVQEKFLRHQIETPLPLGQLRPEVPDGLRAIVDRMLHKDPAARFQTPAEVACAIQSFAGTTDAAITDLHESPGDDSATPTAHAPTFHPAVAQPAGEIAEATAFSAVDSGSSTNTSPKSVARASSSASGRNRPSLLIGGALVLLLVGTGAILYVAGAFKSQPRTHPHTGLPAETATGGTTTSPPQAANSFVELRHELKPHRNRINSLAFSHDSQFLAVACGPKPPTDEQGPRGIQIWDVARAAPLQLLGPQQFPGFLSVAFSPKEHLLAASTGYWNWPSEGFASEVQLWDPIKAVQLARILVHRIGVSSVAFSPDGKTLCTVGRFQDRVVHFWDVSQLLKVKNVENTDSPAHLGQIDWAKDARSEPGMLAAAAFSPNGDRLAVCNHGGVVRLYDRIERNRWVQRGSAECPDCLILYQVALASDGQRIAVAGGKHNLDFPQSPQISWWQADFPKGRKIQTNPVDVWSMAIAADGRHALTGDAEGYLALWDLAEKRPVRRERPHDAWTAVALAPDGVTLATGGDEAHIVKLWRFHCPK
jgi:serine/threonine protein kinase